MAGNAMTRVPGKIGKLIEPAMRAQKSEQAFFELAHCFREASDPKEVEQLGNQLGRFVFGE